MLAEPRAELNLGSEEVRRIARMTPRGPDTEAALAAELLRIMADRLAGYVERGFGGIGEYVRPSDRRASPADELGGAVAALAVFRPAFSEFIETLGSPVSREDEENGSRRLLWVETRFSGTPVWGLVDQARSQTTNAGIAAEIHFYATSAYNSMLTLVAALPYRERTLVVAINLVYTEQVTGLGSALKRRIARHMAATALAKHLERVRERLEP
jgi:hypothetical protein